MTNTSRTNRTTTRDLAALRAEIKALKAQLALHEECLEITAEAIKTLQQKELKKAPASTKQTVKKASAPTEQGRPWSKLTKAEQSRCNKAVWANPKAHGFKDWSDWTEKRTTIMFR